MLTLDFQKVAYGKGSTVNVDFNVEDLKNNPLGNTAFQARVLLKGNIFLEQSLTTNKAGESVITFELPDDLNTADVVLNIEVPYQGSVESISRTVPVLMDNIDLQFLPEGGKILGGTSNTVAFKALNEFGKPADVKGVVLDSHGSEIQQFESFHDGMGTVQFTPKTGTEYFAKITQPFKSDSLYLLPKIHANGATISLQSHKSDATLWNLSSTTAFNGTFQALNATNEILFQESVSLQIGSTGLLVDTSQFPRGIAKFRLLNTQKSIISERLVFLNKHKGLQLELKLNKAVFAPREKVVLEIETKDVDNKPISSNLSIAATDNALVSFADDKQDRIDSYLLMSSELNGEIHEPSFYFDPTEEEADKAIDLVMLTHGWRDYILEPLKYLSFLPDKRNLLTGQVLDKKGNPIAANLFLFESDGEKALQFNTDNSGNFQCKLGDAISYILVAYREDGQPLKIVEKQGDGTISKAKEDEFRLSVPQEQETRFPNTEDPERPLQKPVQEKAIISTNLVEDTQSLDEVVIVGYGANTTKNALGFAQTSVDADEINGLAGTVSELVQGRAAGVQITNSSGISGAGTIVNIRGLSSIRGSNEPLFIVDGTPVTNSFTGDQSAELQNLNPTDIGSISVLKGVAATTLYGSSGVNGVIIITTKKGNYRYDDKILVRKRFNNYAVKPIYKNPGLPAITTPNNFYVPVYDSGESVSQRSDFRKTIYWNPVVQTDHEGKAKVEFYNSDAITSFNITAEGISRNGLIGLAESVYSIQRPLSIATKLPSYCSLNDTIRIPITIANNTNKALKLKLEVNIPEQFEHMNRDDTTDSISVAAKDYLVKELVVLPKAIGKNLVLTVNAHNRSYNDGFLREITIVSPYFPVETSISNSKNGTFAFNITNLVPESTQGQLKVYLDIIGDVMNGIEGMIQKPYGCFEQTSSATYPNIMILKYLNESGKNKPEVEARAMDFIKEGYKRLVRFETSKGGFEWFGHTPPHETLTAFGILEFTEMKEVFSGVDQKMLDRTIRWLLGQKDGEGGFHKSKKGYDSFASSPPKVANAYIVYALSEVGLTSEIEREYRSSLEEAIISEDAYRMALMALASKNLGNPMEYQTLLDKILIQITDSGYDGLPVENTITRSYGKSKKLETTAFVLLSLLRQNQHIDKVAEGIQYLISERKNGRFGSTQATVMSLKALIAYTKKQKQAILENGNTIQLKVNGETIERKLLHTKNGILEIDGIGNFLVEGEQAIEVRFKDATKTFPYAMDMQWESYLPPSSLETPVQIETRIVQEEVTVGRLARMEVVVTNEKDEPVSMTTAVIGIPSGASLQPYQLKELVETRAVDYYEVFDNQLVLYWKSMKPLEKKVIGLDLKAEIPGTYTAPASTVYLYYGDENKHWIPGASIEIKGKLEN
nr:TonB-dependent receptor plug domain-containing protein [Allomuricauda sp.]